MQLKWFEMVAIHPQEIGRGPLMAQIPMIMDTLCGITYGTFGAVNPSI